MDNLRVFGDTSNSKNAMTTTDRLKTERIKALQMLQRTSFPKVPNGNNKENNSQMQNSRPLPSTPGRVKTLEWIGNMAQSSYETSVNISDLIVDNTIHLESSGNSLTNGNQQKVSFEPSEITGRSTCRDIDLLTMKTSQLTVEQILATSCSENVRSLCDSMNESYSGDNNISLPRTADMSRDSKMSSRSNSIGSFSFSNAPKYSQSEFSREDFIPAENMKDKLLNDEKEWAQQFLPMPAIENSNWSMDSKAMNYQNSFGNYFDERCESLVNIVSQERSPLKTRKPVPLVDESISSINESLTPKPDSKTFSRILKSNRNAKNSKDSVSTPENSYLSMSAIEKVLNGIQTDDSDNCIVNRLMLARKTRSCMNPYTESKSGINDNIKKLSLNPEYLRSNTKSQHTKDNASTINRENIQFSDTLSFRNSLLDSSDLQNLNKTDSLDATLNSISNCPVQIAIQNEDADTEDNISFSQAAQQPRRVCYSKSPKRSPKSRTANEKQLEKDLQSSNTRTQFPNEVSAKQQCRCASQCPDITPTNIVSKSSNKPSSKTNQISTSTPERARSLEDVDGFTQKSTNVTKTPSSSSLLNSNCDDLSDKNYDGSRTPEMYESPLSSPRSGISSHGSSPRWNNCHSRSVSMETTTNSERRFLADRASPDFGKMSLPNYGLSNGRPGSTASYKSARCTSQCSNSSEFSHRDGKIMPLKFTYSELSWGSIKLRSSDKKELKMKNTSCKRFVFKISISGPGYQMENCSENLISMQPQECRAISITFCPTVIGSAVGMLCFNAPIGNAAPFLVIPLYGYGGHANVLLEGILRGPVGSEFLTMGEMNELSDPLVKTFKIHNKGPLFGFASISISSRGLDIPAISDYFEIHPNKVIIPPEGTAKISVTFSPSRDILKKIFKKMGKVMTLGILQIITGDEATRLRIRNLIHHLTENEKTKLNLSIVDDVWAKFPKEKDSNDLSLLKENAKFCFELMSTLRTHAIAATLNNLANLSQSTLAFSDADETVLFQTVLYSSTVDLDALDEHNEKEGPEKWWIKPNKFDIDPTKLNENYSFQVKSFYKTCRFFEVSCNFRHLFQFTPSQGNIESNENITINFSFVHQQLACLPNDINILLYLDNNRIKIPINIIKDNYPVQFK